MSFTWGLLGPEMLPNIRRTRTLGLGSSVRLFNELAVPGVGGVKFGKQLLLATLGVHVAERARARGGRFKNIEVANAIEALACWLAFKNNGWVSDFRLRGSTKLKGKESFSFKNVKQRNFYVTQPMRMATVEALPALGLVEQNESRFNSFTSSDFGREFIQAATDDFRPYNKSVIDHLTSWVLDQDNRLESNLICEALSPILPMTEKSIPILKECFVQERGGPIDSRRRHALDWVESIRKSKVSNLRQSWENKPEIISPDHWRDLESGAKFFKARETALNVLDTVELIIGNQSSGQTLNLTRIVPEEIKKSIDCLMVAASEYLELKRENDEAKGFFENCINRNLSQVLSFLVKQDGHVLCLKGNDIIRGKAFRGSQIGGDSDQEEERLPEQNLSLPDCISIRVRNLYLFNLDLHHELDGWLKKRANNE